MSTLQNISLLTQGNIAVRNKDYVAAVGYYICALKSPELEKILAANIQITKQKYRTQRASTQIRHIAIIETQLNDDPESRSQAITTLYRAFADAEIVDIAQILGNHDTHSFISSDVASHIVDFVSRVPFDIVHLIEPCPWQLLIGALYKLIWDAKVFIDLNDRVLEAKWEHSPSLLDARLQELDFPCISTSSPQDWHSIALQLSQELDGVTVTSTAVQQHFGGTFIGPKLAQEENVSELQSSVESTTIRPLTPLLGKLCKIILPQIKPLVQAQEFSDNRVKPTLIPLHQLALDDNDNRYWKSLGEDPYFQLVFKSTTDLKAGWYRIDLLIDTSNSKNLAKFYLDYGQGYSEADTFTLPYETQTLATRVFHFSNPVQTARFDPKDAEGRFRILSLQLTHINENSAKKQILTQIAYAQDKFTSVSLTKLHANLAQQAHDKKISLSELLLNEYDNLFSTDSEQVSDEDRVENIESLNLLSADEIKATLATLAYKPFISIVVSTYNTDEEHLRACIDSVIVQSYPYWELCFADDTSIKPNTHYVLEEYQAQDSRIKLILQAENDHISHTSNSALTLANGDFIIPLEDNSILPKHTLLLIAQAINQNPNAQVLHSFENDINIENEPFSLCSKSDPNKSLPHSQNNASNLLIYNSSLVKQSMDFCVSLENKKKNTPLQYLPYAEKLQIIQISRLVDYLFETSNDARIIKTKLTPVSQLTQDPNDNKYWKSLGTDPYFKLDFEYGSSLKDGWYRIDLTIDSSRKQNTAKFYIDYGQGYLEENTFVLNYESCTHTTRFFYFAHPVCSIRFDPKEAKGRFRVLTLRWSHITEAIAQEQMLTKIAHSNDAYASLSLNMLRSELEQQARSEKITLSELLVSKYNELSVSTSKISYEDWLENIEKQTLPSTNEIYTYLIEPIYHPLISIVIPVYNTDEEYLRTCIDSVITQSYPHWELCIADNASSKPHVRHLLETYQAQDSRIKVVFQAKGSHISHASNSALNMTNGDFVAFLEHNDTLPEHAIFFVAQAITQFPDAQIFYSDEDKLNTKGERFDPHFKSDWNLDLFYSQNYVSHLAIYKRTLLKQIGGFRTSLKSNQDQDLLLRCLPHVGSAQIVHIPRVLYHSRTIESSTTLARGEKGYIPDAGVEVLTDYFAETNPDVRIESGLVPNTYRTFWPVPEPAPLVSLLIPTRDQRTLTETCIRSILEKTTYRNYEILILDNGSVEAETLEFFESIQQEDQRIKVLRYDYPFNYSAINNFGAHHAQGEIIGLVNNDIEVISPEWLKEMVSHAIRPDIGCVGAKLYYSNNTIQHAGVVLGIVGVANHPHKKFNRTWPGYFSRLTCCQNYSAVTAACLVVRKDVYFEVNGLDEDNLKVAYNDVDFCLKIHSAGYRNIWTPYAELYHHESMTRGAENSPEKLERLLSEAEYMNDKWGKLIESDPYYNPNLTRDREDFSLNSSFSKKLTYDGKIPFFWEKTSSQEKDNVCIFVNFDKNSELHDYVIYYLNELAKNFDILFVSTSEKLHENEEAIDKLKNICKSITVRKNEGYDFGSWRLGIEQLGERIQNYHSLLLCNDSVYGPFYDINKIVNEFKESELDVMSASESHEIKYHLQSYFVLYKPSVFTSTTFNEFWKDIKIHNKKWDIIKKYEIGFSEILKRKKFKLGAYCSSKGYPNINITHIYWKDIIESKGFPFIKIELLRDNPINVDIQDWEQVIRNNSNYNTKHIHTHLNLIK